MTTRLDYPTIDKACNGTFIQYAGKWHQLLEITSRCYNFGNDVIPGKGVLVIENSDFVSDQLIISKRTFNLDWINSLPYSTYGACW